jgi:hypothetical protein
LAQDGKRNQRLPSAVTENSRIPSDSWQPVAELQRRRHCQQQQRKKSHSFRLSPVFAAINNGLIAAEAPLRLRHRAQAGPGEKNRPRSGAANTSICVVFPSLFNASCVSFFFNNGM